MQDASHSVSTFILWHQQTATESSGVWLACQCATKTKCPTTFRWNPSTWPWRQDFKKDQTRHVSLAVMVTMFSSGWWSPGPFAPCPRCSIWLFDIACIYDCPHVSFSNPSKVAWWLCTWYWWTSQLRDFGFVFGYQMKSDLITPTIQH